MTGMTPGKDKAMGIKWNTASPPTGLISDVVRPTDQRVGDLLGAGRLAPEKASLVEHFRFDLDQSPNESCVAFSLASASWAAQGISGILQAERKLISADMLYHNTLRRTYGKKATLIDRGCRPRDAVAVLNEVGVCLWEDWPHDPDDPDKVLRDPPGNLQLAGTDTDWIKTFRIDNMWTRKEDTMACLGGDDPCPVFCGLTLDQAYVDLKDQPWPGREGPVVGRHLVVLCGYDQVGPFVGRPGGPIGRSEAWDR